MIRVYLSPISLHSFTHFLFLIHRSLSLSLSPPAFLAPSGSLPQLPSFSLSLSLSPDSAPGAREDLTLLRRPELAKTLRLRCVLSFISTSSALLTELIPVAVTPGNNCFADAKSY
jgi:hypothetical protein